MRFAAERDQSFTDGSVRQIESELMPDVGWTHIALPVRDLDASIAFYAKYASMKVVHRRTKSSQPEHEIAWLSDLTRPFALVLSEGFDLGHPLGPFAHMGIARESRAEVDRLCAEARAEGVPVDGPTDSGPPVGYWAFLRDPDGHTVELTYGQEVGLAVDEAREP